MNSPVLDRGALAERRVGTTLKGKYRVVRLLGVGATAAVYEAAHRNGHRVALKLLHAELCSDPATRTRFLREGYVANNVDHPGSVRVLDDDVTEDGAVFLVMDLLEGRTLDGKPTTTWTAEEVLGLTHQLLSVLGAAHQKGVVHRDIKPENLFLTREGQLKVLDFGLARLRDTPGARATHSGQVFGTPAFMPPEQALGHMDEVDARSDLWAVGATAFYLLSRKLVHETATVGELLVRTATHPARSVREVAPTLPSAVAAVIDRALAFRKADRWPSAEAMQAALERAFSESYGRALAPFVARATGPRPRLGHSRRAPFWVGVLVATGAVVGGLLLILGRAAEEPVPSTPVTTITPVAPSEDAGPAGPELPDAAAPQDAGPAASPPKVPSVPHPPANRTKRAFDRQ